METLHRAVASATVMHTTVYEALRQDARPGILYFNTTMMVCALLALLSVLRSETLSLKTAKRYFVLMPMATLAAKKL